MIPILIIIAIIHLSSFALSLIVAGIVEIAAKTSFFETKILEKKLLKTKKPPIAHTI